MAFKGNVPCTIRKLTDKTDVYGQRVRDTKGKSAKCGIVRLEVGQEKTSVRVDSSATRAHADEITAQSRILFERHVDIAIGDQVEVHGYTLEVTSVFPRYTVNGQLDHFQVDLMVWASR